MSPKRITRAPDDTPEQHPVLELAGHGEGREHQREHEHVVDAQGVLDDVAREPLEADLVAAPDEHAEAEDDRERDPHGGPGECLPRRHDMGGLVEHAQVQGKEEPDKDEEGDPEDQVHGPPPGRERCPALGRGPRAGETMSDDGRRAARRLRNAKAAQSPDTLSDGWMGAEELAGATRERVDRVQVGHRGGHRLLRRLTTASEPPAALGEKLLVDGVEPLQGTGETFGVMGQLGSGHVRAVLARPGHRQLDDGGRDGRQDGAQEHHGRRHAVAIVVATEHRGPERHVAQE